MSNETQIKLNYLTWLQRDLGRGTELLDLPDVHLDTVDAVLNHLKDKGGPYELFGKKHVIFANIDGIIVPHTHHLAGVREITFFSPIVGG